MILGLYRSAAYARQKAHKLHKGESDPLAEGEPLPKTVQSSSSNDVGIMKGEEGGLDASQLKKEKYELSSLVKSVKMKSKQVQLPSDDKKKRGGKLQSREMKKRKH